MGPPFRIRRIIGAKMTGVALKIKRILSMAFLCLLLVAPFFSIKWTDACADQCEDEESSVAAECEENLVSL